MKKKTVWIIVGILALWLGYRAYTNYRESLREGLLMVQSGNITLSYDMISTYMERIDASEQFTLLEHVQDEQGDSLTIDYDAPPYVTGDITVYIPKEADALVEPMAFYLAWSNRDDDADFAEAAKERGEPPIMGRIMKALSGGLFTPGSDLHVKGNTAEECKSRTEDYMARLFQLFAP